MSKEVDERVVEMRFDNRNFESNVRTSMSTLERLKSSLKLDGAAKGFDNINKSAKNVDMSGLGKSVDSVQMKFSALQVAGVTALANIANSAVNAGKTLVQAFTIDPIKSGFQEYETQINAVQTILANTQHEGTNLQQVNNVLDELNTYADKTIYNFTEMTRNIGTFTAAGVGLNQSAAAIKGIANLAAMSGSSSQQASNAMYQLSQAIAAGRVSLMDWNSVVNAGMGGKVFQDALMRTAEAMGIVVDRSVSFRDSINSKTGSGWLTSDVLVKTLEQFTGDMTEAELAAEGFSEAQIQDIMQMADTAMKAATQVKTVTQLFDTLKESAQSGWTQSWEIIIGDFEEARELLTSISDAVGGFINKTSEARNAVLSEGLSSGWKQFLDEGIANEQEFQNVVLETGIAHGAVTDQMIADAGSFANSLKEGWLTSDILAESVHKYSESLSGMSEEQLKSKGYTTEQVEALKELDGAIQNGSVSLDDFVDKMTKMSGRELLIDSFKNIFEGLGQIIKPIGEAFRNIFEPITGSQLYSAIEGFNELTKSFTISEETAQKLKSTFEGLFAAINIVGTIAGGGFKLAFKAVSAVLGAFDTDILSVTASIGEAIVSLQDVFEQAGSKIGGILKDIFDLPFVQSGIAKIRNAISSVIRTINGLGDISFDTIVDSFKYFINNLPQIIANAKGKLSEFASSVKEGFTNIKTNFSDFGDALVEAFEYVKEKLSGIDIGKVITAIFGVSLIAAIRAISKAIASFKSPLASITDILDSFNGVLQSYSTKLKADAIQKIAISIGILAASIVVLTQIDQGKVWSAVGALTVLAGGLLAFSAVMGKIGKVETGSFKITGIAVSILLLTQSLKTLEKLDRSKLIGSLATIGILAGELVAAVAILSKVAPKLSTGMGALLSISVSLMVLVSALKRLNDADISAESIGVLTLIMTEMAALMFAAKLAGKNAAQAGKSMLAMSAALLIITLTLNRLKNIEITSNTIAGLITAIGSLAALMAATRLVGVNSSKAGIGLLGASAALALIIGIIKQTNDLEINSNSIKALTVAVGAIAALMLATRIAGDNAIKAGASAMMMSVAIGLLAGVMALLSMIDPSGLKNAEKAVAILGGVMAGILASTRLAKNCKANLIVISVALGILAGSLGLLSMIDAESLKTATTALASVMGMFSLMTASTGLAKNAAGSLISLVAVVAGLATILGLMSKYDVSASLETSAALSLLLASMAASMALLGSFGGNGSNGSVKSLASLGLVVAEVGAIIGIMSYLNVEPSIETAASLSLLLATMSGVVIALENFGRQNTSLATSISAMKSLGLVVAEIGVVLGAMAYLNAEPAIETAASISLLLATMSGVVIALEAFGGKTGGSTVAIGAMALLGVVVAEIGAILGIMAYLNVEPTIETAVSLSALLLAMSAALAVLSAVGATGPASFIGIGALLTFVTSMGAFMVGVGALMQYVPQIQSFLDTGIPVIEQVANGIGSIFGNIVGGFAEGITDSLPNIGSNLSAFMSNLQPFVSGAQNIDSSSLDGIKTIAETLLLITGGNLLESITSFVTGSSSIEQFGTQIVAFGNAIKQYGTAVSGIDTSGISQSVEAGRMLAELGDIIPNSGGLAGAFAGGNNIDDFGERIVPFGEAIKEYCAAVSGIDISGVSQSVEAGRMLAELADIIPNSGGLAGAFAGGNNIDDFGERIVPFGEAIKNYCAAVSGIDISGVSQSVEAGRMLAELADIIPNSGGLAGAFAGGNNIDDFGERIVTFGAAIKSYGDTVAQMNVAAISSSIDAANKLAELANITNQDYSQADSFRMMINGLGSAIKSYGEKVSEIDVTKINTSINAIRNLANMAGSVTSEYTSTESFGKMISDLGTAIETYNNKISGIDTAKILTSVSTIRQLSSFSTTAGTGESLVTFGNNLSIFGMKLSEFASKAGGLNLAGVSANLQAFGESMKTFGSSGIDGFVSAFESAVPRVSAAASNMMNAAISAVTSGAAVFSAAGVAFSASFANGISASAGSAAAAGMILVTAAVSAVNAGMGTLLNLGIILGTSFATGISSTSGMAMAAGMTIAAAAVSAVTVGSVTITSVGILAGTSFASGLASTVGIAMSSGMSVAIAAASGALSQLGMFIAAGQNLGMGIATGVSSASGAIYSAAASAAQSGASGARGAYSSFYSAGSYIASGLAAGIRAAASEAVAAAQAMASQVQAAASSALSIASPSKVFIEIGKYVGEGLSIGISDSTEMSRVSASTYKLANNVIDAAKDVLEIHSPSKAFIALGNRIGEGLAQGIRDSSYQAVYWTEDMGRRIINAANQSFEDVEKWVENAKAFDELALSEELELWERVIEQYQEGTEEWLDANKNAYDVYKQLQEENYQNSVDWIDREKEYNRLTLEEEIAAWERIQARYIEGTEERKEADLKLYQLKHELIDDSLSLLEQEVEKQKALVDSLEKGTDAYKEQARELEHLEALKLAAQYEHSLDWIENEKYYDRIGGLAGELAAYTRVLQRHTKGTEEYEEVLKEIYRLQKDIYDSYEQYQADMAQIEEDAHEQRMEYYDELQDKIQELNDEYDDAVKSRTQAIYDSYGLFDEVSKKDPVTGAELYSNLEDQVKEINEWDSLLDQLSARGLNEALIEELQEMGPDAVAELRALNDMSDSELAQYANLWFEKYQLAKDRAVQELEDTRLQTAEEIADLEEIADHALSGYENTWDEHLQEINQNAKESAEQLTTDFLTELGIIKPETEKIMQEMVTLANNVLRQAGFDERGKEIVESYVSGMQGAISAVLSGDDLGAYEMLSALVGKDIPTIEGEVVFRSKTSDNELINIVEGNMPLIEGEVVYRTRTAIEEELKELEETSIAYGQKIPEGISEGVEISTPVLEDTMTNLAAEMSDVYNSTSADWSENGKDISNKVSDGIKASSSDAKAAVVSVLSDLNTAFDGYQSNWNETGQEIVDGIIVGMESRRSSLINTAIDLANDVNNAFRSRQAFDIHSPSRVTSEMGRELDQGFVIGILGHKGEVLKAGSEVSDDVIRSMSDSISKVSGIMSGDIETSPTIRPILDLTDVRNGIGMMDNEFNAGRSVLLSSRINSVNQNGFENRMNDMLVRMAEDNYKTNSAMASSVEGLRNDFSELVDKVTRLQVVMDTGTLVGAITPEMDRSLGNRAMMNRRGIR